MSKEEFKNRLDNNQSVKKGAFTFYKYSNVYTYICDEGTCFDSFENFEELWDFVTFGSNNKDIIEGVRL